MPYRFLGDIAPADAAFEAWADSEEELFAAAADATLNVMVEDLDSVEPLEGRAIHLESDSLEMLLFELLQEILYFKDAESLLLRTARLHIESRGDRYVLSAIARGEAIDPQRHLLLVDVKAVTLHRFRVEETDKGWEATVVLDT